MALRHKWQLEGPPKPSTPTTTAWTWRCARCGKDASTFRTRRRPRPLNLRPAPRPPGGDCGLELVLEVHSL